MDTPQQPLPSSPATFEEINQTYTTIASEQGEIQFKLIDLRLHHDNIKGEIDRLERRQRVLWEQRNVLQEQMYALTAKERAVAGGTSVQDPSGKS